MENYNLSKQILITQLPPSHDFIPSPPFLSLKTCIQDTRNLTWSSPCRQQHHKNKTKTTAQQWAINMNRDNNNNVNVCFPEAVRYLNNFEWVITTYYQSSIYAALASVRNWQLGSYCCHGWRQCKLGEKFERTAENVFFLCWSWRGVMLLAHLDEADCPNLTGHNSKNMT